VPISTWSDVERFSVERDMPPEAWTGDAEPLEPDPYRFRHRPHPLGAGYLVRVARELTGLSQERLAERIGTSQASIAKIQSGSRIPTVRTLMRVARATGFELLLGLREFDSDPPRGDTVDGSVLLGAILSSPDDDLADFVVLKEPSIFDGPRDTHEV
jgi:transcriptional regulator with XRE-family HTH domain